MNPRPHAPLPETQRHRWPPDRFYWAVLEAPGVHIGSPRPPGAAALDLQLADNLPLPVEDVHAVYARVDAHRVLACAASRADLAALDPDALTLHPAATPAFAGTSPDSRTLNLLTGDFEPAPLRRARGRTAVWTAATLLALSALAAIGLLRRARHFDTAARVARTEALAAAAAAIPELGVNSAQPRSRLAHELDMLRATHRPASVSPSPDAAAALAALLSAWPLMTSGNNPTAHAISITPTTMSLSLAVENDAAGFLSNLGTPPGWVKDEPHVSRTPAGVHAAVRYSRSSSQ